MHRSALIVRRIHNIENRALCRRASLPSDALISQNIPRCAQTRALNTWSGKETIERPTGNANQTTTTNFGDFKPVKLSYAAFDSKVKEGEKKKEPLVILHSLLGRKKNWKTVAKEVNRLSRRKVISADARNHGDSPHVLEMSYSLMAKDMTELFKDLDLEKIDFLGHSMGGRIGMILALTQPQLINKLICVDATPVNTPSSIERWQILGEACKFLKEMEPDLRQQQGVNRSILADKLLRPILPNQYDRSLFLSNLIGTNTNKEEDKTAPLWRLNIDAVIANPFLTASFPSFSGVQFKGKTLFVAGSHSKFVRKEHEETIMRLFPNAKIVIIPDCGHWVHAEKHKEFMEILMTFLEK